VKRADVGDAFLIGFAFVATLMIILGSGCGAAVRPIVTDHVITVPVTERCAKRPPPTFTGVPDPVPCLPGMLCYTVPNGDQLAHNIQLLIDWVNETWAGCAPIGVSQ